jgi:hypothetical protein
MSSQYTTYIDNIQIFELYIKVKISGSYSVPKERIYELN